MADLKASLCGELPNQNSVIPQEQLRDLLERRGIVEDPDIPNAKARLAEQELRRNMYHNTQVMMTASLRRIPAKATISSLCQTGYFTMTVVLER